VIVSWLLNKETFVFVLAKIVVKNKKSAFVFFRSLY